MIFAFSTFYTQSKAQAFITAPIMSGNNAPNTEICEKSSIHLKFEFYNFPAVTFTVEMAANGDFVNGPIITLIGQTIPGLSGGSPNQHIDVSLPAPPNGILANTNYQVRIKGSSPLTYSPPNLYPFKIAKLGNMPDLANFPEGYWRGSFFTWTPNVQTIITDANTQDMFNPGNYLGYVTKKALSFEYNWGFDVEAAPGNAFDTSNVCGSHANFYSIRLRRKINFEAGYYIFGGGGDDGFRLSLDGGTTWLINLWADHEYAGKLNNNGCGIYLDTGPKNVVVDYYERAEHSRIRVIIKRTGDPLANPLQITDPVDGASVCIQASPFQLISNAPGGEDWSGPGVSPSGLFDPQAAGLGFKTITYETGMAAFGSNCLKTTSITIQVVPGLSTEFSMPDSSYCQGDSAVKLTPQNPGGTFWGEGVSGSYFYPASVSSGQHLISYSLDQTSGCGSDTTQKYVNVLPKPDAGFQGLPDSVYLDSPNITLIPIEPGGVFSGDGVVSSSQKWVPSILPPGEYTITYTIKKGLCSNQSSQKSRVLEVVKPVLVIPNFFSPNGDGDNDQWTVIGGKSGMKVTIINRWGKEVYKGTSQGETLCKREDLPDLGQYFFLLENPADNKKWTGYLTVTK